MQCHQCPHSAAVAAGRYRHKPFDQTPCASCTLTESSVGTKEHNPNIEADHQELVALAATEETPMTSEQTAPADHIPITVMHELVRLILALPPIVRDTVCMRFAGHTYAQIAAAHNVTTTVAARRHTRALAKHPILNALFPVKAARKANRSTAGRLAISL